MSGAAEEALEDALDDIEDAVDELTETPLAVLSPDDRIRLAGHRIETRSLAAAGARTLLGCRNPEKGAAAVARIKEAEAKEVTSIRRP